ncbi:efflux transporter outer membrane subunit [Candidatus Protochlamydia phocaeensis]|uniref:efflux transporter outer membrane subunit n=1 Tax=Candidatus Protochlamydia phocaeensis TaxID=1414722 RepID=UPI0008396D60|nr:efflux transporter outer membrane subunit [Candidatus Protochlamydia phocaeensis]
MRSFWPLTTLFLAVLTGCNQAPLRDELPEMDNIPCSWEMSCSDGMHEGPLDQFLWWESLNDPMLNFLIQRASQQNFDLSIAAMRVLEARQEQKAGDAKLYPHIDGSLTAGHLYFSKEALLKGLLRDVKHKKSIDRNVNFFEIGFDAEWEIDLFGATAHEINALRAELEAAEENLGDVWVTLSAEIARNYIELRSAQQRLALLEANLSSQQDTIHLTKALLHIGQASDIDLKQAEDQLVQLAIQKPLLDLAINKSIHRLSILLGYAPNELACELKVPASLPLLPCDKPIGIPSELLRRRPDIRRAERQLAAAAERVDAAIASLFPRFSLRGFVGDISTQLHSLLNPSSTTYFIAPQLLAPIFNSKLIQQNIDYNKIKTREALYSYQKTVLEALEETENAIASFHYELERYRALADAVKANQDTYALMMQLYERGVKSYLEVQTANRSLLSSQDAYLQSQVNLLLHYISLYKALGGAWAVQTSDADGPNEPAC